MKVMVNLTKPEAECLVKMIDSLLVADLSGAPSGPRFKNACLPLLNALRDKIDAQLPVKK